MPFSLIFEQAWRWIADTGINIALLIVLAFLVPRAGRLANRYIERKVTESSDADESKSSLAIAGVGIYIVQLIAYFLILVFFLQQIGFSLAGAAIPATVVSAAIGFGAQQIIADFVAGFFILSEKQYGVGDLVTFQGGSVDVTGTVIQITMRSTQVRTLEEYTVTIPNSAAQVCINNSNHWSRALVVVPVPLLGSNNTEEVIARADSAARRALADPEISPLIRGELLSQPGLNLNPPATVGMPWTLDIRYMVRCSPGDQFPIERAINVYLLEEFFDEYGSATTASGAVVDTLDDARTTAFAPAFASKRYASDWDYEEEPNTSPTSSISADGPETKIFGADEDEETDPEHDPAAATTTKKHRPFGSFGGRTRASTGLLIAVFLGLLIFRGLTMSAGEDSDASSGVLAPPRSSTSTTAPASPTNTNEPTRQQPTQPTPAPETSRQPTPAPTTPNRQPNQQPTPTQQAPQEQPSQNQQTPENQPSQQNQPNQPNQQDQAANNVTAPTA